MTAVDEAPRTQVIRLALVMNGGVSLAVWMGGVTHELDRLLGRHGRQSAAWQKILDVTTDAHGRELPPRRVVVDYVAGTSAGGLNGCVLATSIARGGDLPALKSLWIDKGVLDASTLLPSLQGRGHTVLDGGFFHTEIRNVIRSVADDESHAQDVSLLVTSTALAQKDDPETISTEDSLGNVLEIADHRRVYLFASRARSSEGDGDFADTDTLALAARASASFPAAFEPVEESAPLADRRTGGRPASRSSRTHRTWLIDGGVLDNAPFEPLLDEMVRQPRPDHGERWVVYVVPTAPERRSAPDTHTAVRPRMVPSWSSVVKSLWSTKSEVDLRSDLQTLRRLQSEASAVRLRPEEFMVSAAAAELDAAALLASYRTTRADGFARYVRGMHEKVEKLGTRPIPREQTDDLLMTNPLFIPSDLSQTRGGAWQWGVVVAQHLLLWMSRDARASEQSTDVVRQLAEAERSMTVLGERVRALYTPDRFRNSQPAYIAKKTASGLEPLMRRVAEEMTAAVDVWARARGFQQDAWHRLLATEVLTNHAEWHVRPAPPRFDVVLVNPGSPSVDPFVFPDTHSPSRVRPRPDAKLYGTRLGHFAAFGAKEYRENDWLWGRLDAAGCLAKALLRDVDGDTSDELRRELMAEILASERTTAGALAQRTAEVERLDEKGLLLDMIARGEVDTDELAKGLVDMLLPTEDDTVDDAIADAVISTVGGAVSAATTVTRAILRVTDRAKGLTERVLRRLNTLE